VGSLPFKATDAQFERYLEKPVPADRIWRVNYAPNGAERLGRALSFNTPPWIA